MNFSEVQSMRDVTGNSEETNTVVMGHSSESKKEDLSSFTNTPTSRPSLSGIPSGSPLTSPLSGLSSSSPLSSPLSGLQSGSPLSSPTSGFSPTSRPSIARMWGIGGFTSPSLPPPPAITPNTIASTLGNPQMPSVTYFNSRAPMGFNFRMAGSLSPGAPFVFKRKPEDEPEEVIPAMKQHISEERMAAHLNALHLSNKYLNHRLGKRGWTEDLDVDEDEGLGEEHTVKSSTETSNGEIRLVIADEVKKIVPGESQLPQSLLKKLSQPSMEVVLWRPPGDVIRNIVTSSRNHARDDRTCGGQQETSFAEPAEASAPKAAATPKEGSPSSSPDSGVSVTSPVPSLSVLGQHSASSSSSPAGGDDLLSLPSTSVGTRRGYFAPLRRPASPLPDPMASDDFSERMEYNNNNGNAPNFMWLEENNNSALIDLNAVQSQRALQLEDLPDLPDSDDMEL